MKKAVDKTELHEVINECLIAFFEGRYPGCECSNELPQLLEELQNCKSLILTQSVLINQLQNDIADMKIKMYTSLHRPPPFGAINEKRRSGISVRTLEDVEIDTLKSDNECAPASLKKADLLNQSTSNRTDRNVTHTTESVTRAAPTITFPNTPSTDIEDGSKSRGAAQYDDNSSKKHQNNLNSAHNRAVTIGKNNKRFASKNFGATLGAKAKLMPVEKFSYIYVSNLSPNQSTDDVMSVLRELDENEHFEVEKPNHLNKKTTSSAFVIKAPQKYYSVLRDPDFWPANTFVNRYYFPKKTDQPNFQVPSGNAVPA